MTATLKRPAWEHAAVCSDGRPRCGGLPATPALARKQQRLELYSRAGLMRRALRGRLCSGTGHGGQGGQPFRGPAEDRAVDVDGRSPAHREDAWRSSPTVDPEAARALLRGKRAVIVEDEGMTVWQLTKMLKGAGLQVVGSAGDGRRGVEVVLRERPDIVLMDITMPEMNGMDATREILSSLDTCVVMVSAYEEFRDEAARLGACGYLAKPVMSQTLLSQLASAVTAYEQARRGPDQSE